MSEFSSAAAHRTPTSFSADIRTPFVDMGMGKWNDDQIGELFEAKTVLDIGSGFEGTARRLFSIFSNTSNAPTVINLNPQFSDWRMRDVYENGQRRSFRQYKQKDIEEVIYHEMGESGEDFEGYFAQRIAVTGLVQRLPIAEASIDIVTSTWGFPTCFYDCGGSDWSHEYGYREVLRVLRYGGGLALLAPTRLPQHQHASQMLGRSLSDKCSYEFRNTGKRWGGQEYVLELTKH